MSVSATGAPINKRRALSGVSRLQSRGVCFVFLTSSMIHHLHLLSKSASPRNGKSKFVPRISILATGYPPSMQRPHWRRAAGCLADLTAS